MHSEMSRMGMRAVAMVMVQGVKHETCILLKRAHVKPFLQ